MTTLRREIRKNIEKVLKDRLESYIEWGEETGLFSSIAEEIADALNSNNPNFFSEEPVKPKIDLAKSDPAWAILFGSDKEIQQAVDNSKLLQDARNSFERDMGFNPLPWDSTKDWQKMSKFVVQEYEKDKLIFAKYKTWQKEDGKYVALSNRKIKERPGDFIACFPDFLAHTAMYPRVEKVDDDNDDFEFKNEIYI